MRQLCLRPYYDIYLHIDLSKRVLGHLPRYFCCELLPLHTAVGNAAHIETGDIFFVPISGQRERGPGLQGSRFRWDGGRE